jgi:hypothetical protein
MKFVKIAGLCLASMLVMGMALTGTASAAPHWLVCLAEHSGTTTTKWSSSACTTAKASGGFEWSELAGTEAAHTKGSLLLKDTAITVKSEVECYGESEGAVGPGKYGRVNKINVTPAQCHGVKNCETVLKIEARNTPWQTELFESEKGVILQALSSTGAGEPGWEVECKVGSNVVNDVCTQEPGTQESILLENKATGTELLVLGTFQKLRKAKCSTGGKAVGEVVGSLAGFITGKGLRVSS